MPSRTRSRPKTNSSSASSASSNTPGASDPVQRREALGVGQPGDQRALWRHDPLPGGRRGRARCRPSSVASLRTKPLSSRITDSFSPSLRPVSRKRGEPVLQPGDRVGRDRRAADRDAQRPTGAAAARRGRPRPSATARRASPRRRPAAPAAARAPRRPSARAARPWPRRSGRATSRRRRAPRRPGSSTPPPRPSAAATRDRRGDDPLEAERRAWGPCVGRSRTPQAVSMLAGRPVSSSLDRLRSDRG